MICGGSIWPAALTQIFTVRWSWVLRNCCCGWADLLATTRRGTGSSTNGFSSTFQMVDAVIFLSSTAFSSRSKKSFITEGSPCFALHCSRPFGRLVVMSGCRFLNPLHHFAVPTCSASRPAFLATAMATACNEAGAKGERQRIKVFRVYVASFCPVFLLKMSFYID